MIWKDNSHILLGGEKLVTKITHTVWSHFHKEKLKQKTCVCLYVMIWTKRGMGDHSPTVNFGYCRAKGLEVGDKEIMAFLFLYIPLYDFGNKN